MTALFALLVMIRESGPHFYSVSGPLEPRQDHFDRIFTIHSREARGLTAFLHAQTPFGQAAGHVDRIFTSQNKGAHFQPHFYTQKNSKTRKARIFTRSARAILTAFFAVKLKATLTAFLHGFLWQGTECPHFYTTFAAPEGFFWTLNAVFTCKSRHAFSPHFYSVKRTATLTAFLQHFELAGAL